MAIDRDSIRENVIAAARTVFDPEIPVNIYELGLIYSIDVSDEGDVAIRMTLTSPNCPVADKLPAEVQRQVSAIPSVRSAKVELVFDPPWSRDMMSEVAQLELEMMGVASPSHLHQSRPPTTDITVGRTSRRESGP